MQRIHKDNLETLKLNDANKPIWQTASWAKTLLKSNQAEEIFVLHHPDSLYKTDDYILVEKRSVWFGDYGLFALWITDNADDYEEVLIDLAKKEKSLFVQFEYLEYDPEINGIDNGLMQEWYYKKFITPYTAVIDLEPEEDEILKSFKQKCRYNIRLAWKKGVEVVDAEKTHENIKAFHKLMSETTSRDGFSGNNFEYYKTFLEKNKNSKLFIAYKDEEAIAAGIFIPSWNVFIYYYGASTSDKKYRNLMAPYLMQWTAIKYAKENWFKLYDFLWVATPGDKKSSLAWVTNFKLKFTDTVLNVSQSYIFINKKVKYSLISILRKLKSLIK